VSSANFKLFSQIKGNDCDSLKFMLHFKMGGRASVVVRPGRQNPQLRHLFTYSMQSSSS